MFFKRRPQAAERRAHRRIAPPGAMRIDHEQAGKALTNAEVINISKGGVAMRADEPVTIGERLIFAIESGVAPVHCEVLDCQEVDSDWYYIRCRCIMGGFDIDDDEEDDS